MPALTWFPALSLLTIGALYGKAPIPARINCGGWPTDWTDTQGKLWLTDRYYTGGGIDYYAIQDAGVNSFQLSTSRDGGYTNNFAYHIPVPAGSYSVTLHLALVQNGGDGRR